MQKKLSAIILLGVIWGFFEATFGGILHFFLFAFTGQIMSAIGFIILAQALKSRKGIGALLIIPIIAAAIKLSDLYFFPENFHAIIKPAISIMLQGLGFVVLTRFINIFDKSPMKRFSGIYAVSCAAVLLPNLFFLSINAPLWDMQILFATLILKPVITAGVTFMGLELLSKVRFYNVNHYANLISALLLGMTICTKAI